ncbi:MAG TPA: hypothetical protein VJM11_16385 [Nevskiaceae bacterium]|nr:hypothetical protein [Nevskiaceae bacterium]
MITGVLAKRLQVIDWAKRHPAIASETIDRPFVITGLPRSGTRATVPVSTTGSTRVA